MIEINDKKICDCGENYIVDNRTRCEICERVFIEGKKEARKEFLDKLKFFIKDEYRIRIGRHPERDKHIIRYGNNILNRLKQSLGEKT